MATKIKGKIDREVHTRTYGDMIARFTPEGVYMKEKGRRTWVGPTGYGVVYEWACRASANEAARAKKEERALKKVSRGLLST